MDGGEGQTPVYRRPGEGVDHHRGRVRQQQPRVGEGGGLPGGRPARELGSHVPLAEEGGGHQVPR